MEKLVPDGLWERVTPLRRPIDDRAALAGIVFVFKTGITWNQLLTRLVGCSGVTCWRRLRDRTEAGGPGRLHRGESGTA